MTLLRIIYNAQMAGSKQDGLGRWVREGSIVFPAGHVPAGLLDGAQYYEIEEDVDPPKEVGMIGEHNLGGCTPENGAWGFHTGKRIMVRSSSYGDLWDLYRSMISGNPGTQAVKHGCGTAGRRR